MAKHTVAKTGDLADGQMKQVTAGEHKLLLVRTGGEYRALGASCPHHGAPLAEGLCHEGHIVCPWHAARFDATDGSLLDPPALDALPSFPVEIDGDDVVVDLPEEPPETAPAAMASRDDAADDRTFVILGGGAAGLTAAETLRREGFRGRLLMVTREDDPPYDRTDLSKSYLSKRKPYPPGIRRKGSYESHGIELTTGFEVATVDAAAGRLADADGREIAFDRLLMATGGLPRTLDAPGADLDGVVTLRGLADAKDLRRRIAEAERAVVVGASFIGMEVAAGLTQRGLKVTVVAPDAVPFARTFGQAIGDMYRRVHEGKGVAFRLGAKVAAFEGDGKLDSVVLADGTAVPAALAVLGVGVRPATGFLDEAETNDDGSVTVDQHLRVAGDVFAAGDIARFPAPGTGGPMRIEHWRVAQQQGAVAAANMLDRGLAYRRAPFFWTNQYMVITDYAGRAVDPDDVVIEGDLDAHDFLAYYVKEGAVHAVAGCGRSRAVAAALEVLDVEPLPGLDDLRKTIADLAG